MTESGDCPSENELLARAAGGLSAAGSAALDAHIDVCSSCRVLLAEAAAGSGEVRGRSMALGTFERGESVSNRYTIRRRLAAGGMGEVYEAHDAWLDELVAIKTIVPTIADDERALARLKGEVRLARRVTHRNVCRVYDLGFHKRDREQIAFLTMELVQGTTLRRYLQAHGPMSADAVAPLVQQMVGALGHAHAAGIVHRDFKPDNVMLVESNDGSPARVVVMDFGLARSALVSQDQPLTPSSHTVLGTLDYMAPEQVQGASVGPASDIYSLGVVLYELFTGRLPFDGETPLARALLRVTQKAPRLRDAKPDLDSRWNACVARCLELRPQDRFETVTDVLVDVMPAPKRTHARNRRRVSVVAAFGVSLIALGILAAGRDSGVSATPTGAGTPPKIPPARELAVNVDVAAPPASMDPLATPPAAAPARGPAPPLVAGPARAPQRTAPIVAAAPAGSAPPQAATPETAASVTPRPEPPHDDSATRPAAPPGNALLDPFASPR